MAAKTIELWPVDRLIPYERNARTHSPEQVRQIAASIQEFGFTNPILVDSDDGILAGHGRLAAARDLAMDHVPVIVLDHLSPAQRRAYVLADNKLALNAGWDEELLQQELAKLQIEDFDLDVIGFSEEEIAKLLDPEGIDAIYGEGFDSDDGTRTEEEEAEEEDRSNDGSLLALADIAIDDPKTVVERGDIWKVGPHLLFACSVMTDWQTWSKHLNSDEAIFCPYPGPFVPLGEKANHHVLVMVQPDPYVAGHVIDRYIEVHGKASVKKAGTAE